MRHLILEQGCILNAADNTTVEAINGRVIAIANGNTRTSFIFDTTEGRTALHLDRNMRPASRLLLLISGAIPYDLHTCRLHIISQQGERPGQSRLRLKVGEVAIPAPEAMPDMNERRARNVQLLDTINAALGISAYIADEEDEVPAEVNIISETEPVSFAGAIDSGRLTDEDLRPVFFSGVRVTTTSPATEAAERSRETEENILASNERIRRGNRRITSRTHVTETTANIFETNMERIRKAQEASRKALARALKEFGDEMLVPEGVVYPNLTLHENRSALKKAHLKALRSTDGETVQMRFEAARSHEPVIAELHKTDVVNWELVRHTIENPEMPEEC